MSVSLVASTTVAASLAFAASMATNPSVNFAPGAITNAIAALFSAGQQGAWYDPSDFSTLFQDTTGAVPVTAITQPVGLMLDKRLGLVRGPERITNGDFSSATGWTLANAVVSGGQLVVTNGARFAAQPSVMTPGAYHQVGFTYAAGVGSNRLRINSLGTDNAESLYEFDTPNGSSGVVNVIIKATGSFLSIEASLAVFTGVIDNVTVKLLDGNHLSQPTAAARPLVSARVNLFTQTEQFDGNDWGKTNATIVPNAATAPNGTLTADKLVNTAAGYGFVYRSENLTAGVNSFSMHAEQAGATELILERNGGVTAVFNLATGTIVSSSNGAVPTIEPLGNGRYRCEISFIEAAAVTATLYAGRSTGPFGGGEGIYLWGAQRTSGAKSRYQRVNTATDYDGAGFPVYLKFDGIDDGMSASTGGGGTAGYFHCAAIRTASVAAGQREIWSDQSGTAGYFTVMSAASLRLYAANGVFPFVDAVGSLAAGVLDLVTTFDDGATINAQITDGVVGSAARALVSAGSAGFSIMKQHNGAANYFAGDYYGSVYVKDSGLTPAQRASVKAFIRGKVGL